jgi:hypothetical protein
MPKARKSEVAMARPHIEIADHRHRRPLSTRRERPCSCAAEQCDELASFQLTKLHALVACQANSITD